MTTPRSREEIGKYVIRADGSVRLGNKNNIHAYMACGCPNEDCPGRAVAAGYFKVVDGQLEVYGESTTLGLKAKPEDTALIRDALTKKNPTEV